MKIIEKYKNINSCVCIDSWIIWDTIVIFSWIHGNEKSWIYWTEKIFEQLKSKNIVLKKWKIIIVFKANEKAVKINKREVEKNMNRLFRDDLKNRNWYEELRALELMNLLKESNYLLDLHSTSGASIPFIFSEMKHFSFAKKLGISHIVWWWWELTDWVVSGDTENYMNNLWWVWVTFEAWNHDNPEWWENAYQMIINYLSVLNMIDAKYFKNIWKKENIFTNIKLVYVAKTNKFEYSISVDNFNKIDKWTLIAKDWEEKIYAEKDMVLILPKEEKNIKKWIEAFFIADQII